MPSSPSVFAAKSGPVRLCSPLGQGFGWRHWGLSAHLSYVEAVVVGAAQGITELFPVSSLGHAVLVAALAGGQWARDLNVSAPQSPYLAFIVGLHVATAAALLVFFWRDWVRILSGFVSSARHRRVER